MSRSLVSFILVGAALAVPARATTAPLPDPGGCLAPDVDDRCEVAVDRYDGGDSDMTASDLDGSELIALTDDGALVLTIGASDVDPSSGRRQALAVTAMDTQTGAHVWDARFPSAADTWTSTIVTSGQRGFALGYDLGTNSCEPRLRLIAFDVADGREMWTRLIEPPAGSCIGPRALAIAGGAHLIVGYNIEDADGHSHGMVSAVSAATGDIVWSHELLDPDPLFNVGTSSSALAFDPAGNVLIAGSAIGIAGVGGNFPKHLAWVIERLDAADGARSMASRWDVPRGLQSNAPANPPASVRASTDGSTIYLAGGVETAQGHSFDIVVLALDPTGTTRWVGTYDGPRSNHLTNPVKQQASFDSVWFNGAMEVSSEGDVLVTGYSSSEVIAPGLWYDFVTIRFSHTDGTVEWSRRYGSETYLNWIPSLQLTPDGSTVVINGQSRIDAVLYAARSTTIAYDAISGEQRWVARYTDGHTFPQGLAISHDGTRAYVAASSANLDGGYVPQVGYPSYDVVTLAYDI